MFKGIYKLLWPGLILIAGCGVQAQMYDACAGFPPNTVETLVTLAESDKASGYSKSQELQSVLAACWGSSPDCLSCGTAVVDYVYGGKSRDPQFYQMNDQEWKEFVWGLPGDVVFDLALALAPGNEPYGRDDAPEVVTP